MMSCASFLSFAQVFIHGLAQGYRGNDFNLVSPTKKMPAHFA